MWGWGDMAEIDRGISIDAVGMSVASPPMIHPFEAEKRRRATPYWQILKKRCRREMTPEN